MAQSANNCYNKFIQGFYYIIFLVSLHIDCKKSNILKLVVYKNDNKPFFLKILNSANQAINQVGKCS